jgi:hypothetical protein
MHITTAIAVSLITLIDYALWGTSQCHFARSYPLRVLLRKSGPLWRANGARSLADPSNRSATDRGRSDAA